MKLGYHSEVVGTATVALIQAAGHVPILLTLDLDPGRLAAIRPYVGLLIGRVYIADETPYLGHGAQLAQYIAARVAPVAHLLDGVCCLNEPDVSTPQKAAVVAQTIIDATSLLHAAGLRVVAGNFSTGTPALESDPDGGAILDALVPALHEITLGPGGYLGLHEYSAPSMRFEAGYLCGRYIKLLDALGTRGCHVPAIMTEVGIDFGSNIGYAGRVTDDAYLADLQWYAGLIEADPRVVAAAVFEAGSYDAFASFDITRTGLGGRLAQWMGQQSHEDGPSGPGGGKVPYLTGIDVSSLQPGTDWAAVAANGHSFAMIKATEGTGYRNPWFPHDWDGAAAAGLIRGAYHFARPDAGNTPEAEADYFLAYVGGLVPGDLLVLDFEVGTGNLAGWAQAWLDHVVGRVGFRPIFYTYPSFITEHGLGTAGLAAYPLWYASYQQAWPPTPGQWAGVAIWQHSDNATVPGIAGIVDENYSALTADELRALGKKGDVPMVDTLTVLALNQAKAANPAISPNVDSANFKAYRAWIGVWDAAGRPDYLNPGPWLRNEAATATDAYVPLDNGATLHSTLQSDGQWHTYAAELKERAAIYAAMGWGKVA